MDELNRVELHRRLGEISVASILRNQLPNGAIIASPDFAEYHFCWLRDGSFIAHALDTAGKHEAAGRYHAWVQRAVENIGAVIDRVVESHLFGAHLDPLEMPPARFTLEGSVVVDGWPNFQIDGYGTWLWSLGRHLNASHATNLSDEMKSSVARVGRYLSAFATTPCYDVWEESGSAVHTSTQASVYAGLVSAARILDEPTFLDSARAVKARMEAAAEKLGYYAKSNENDDVDASALWLVAPFGVVGPAEPQFVKTVELIENRLTLNGGIRRYSTDEYYGSGAWPVLTASLGLCKLAQGDLHGAMRCQAWIADQFDVEGRLGEQFGGEIRDPEHYREWVERWGDPASDLMWSHAMYVILSAGISESEALGDGHILPDTTLSKVATYVDGRASDATSTPETARVSDGSVEES